MIETRTGADGKKRYRVRGERGGQWRTFTKKEDADKYDVELRRAKQRERAGMEEEKGPISYTALCELYEDNFAPSRWRLTMLAHSKKRWGKLMVRSIQPEAVGQWLHTLPLASKTQSHILETMRQVCKAGVDWGYLQRSPVRPGAFKAPSQKRQTPINPFASWEEVVLVADACEALVATAGALVKFICSTGLTSPSEWREARWSDVDLVAKDMIVHGTKTVNRARTIPLSKNALDALALLPAPLTQSQRVFQSKTGGPFDYHQFRKEWKLALAAAGLEHRPPNEMRHTFATLALVAGVPIDDVADLLGHSNVSITFEFYRKWVRGMKDRARNILDTIGEEEHEHEAVSADPA